MEDQEIIALYWNRDQRAITETSEKYGAFLQTIAWNVLHNHSDADECVNDTYLRTWNAIPPTRPSAFRVWLGRITRNLSLDRWKQANASKRGGTETELLLDELDACVPCHHGTEQAMEDREIATLISEFLRSLSTETRIIFLRRYWYGDSISAIAGRLHYTQGKIKSTLFRTRNALKAYLEDKEVLL